MSNEQTTGDLILLQLRPYLPLSQRRRQISNICIVCPKNTSAVSWWFLGVQQQMSQRDGTASGSAAIKEPLLPAWNVATHRGNYWSEACWANTITLTNGQGKCSVKWWPLEVGWLKKTGLDGPRVYSCLPLGSKTFSTSSKSWIYWYKLFPALHLNQRAKILMCGGS